MFLGHPISRQTHIALNISQPNVVVSPCVSRSDTVGANVPRAVQVLTLPQRAAGKVQLYSWVCCGYGGSNPLVAGHFGGFETTCVFFSAMIFSHDPFLILRTSLGQFWACDKTADLRSTLVKSANI